MKKLFLSLIAAIIAATASYAQSSLLATLSHEDTISTYYGATALRDAYAAAADGDVITLSSGSFSAVNIAKSITIRGAGMAVDATAQTEPTVITGDFTINIAEEITKSVTLEGLYHNHALTIEGTLNGATFLKTRFGKINASSAQVNNLTMIQCRVAGEMIYRGGNVSSVYCINCIVNKFWNNGGDNNTIFEFVNSIVTKENFGEYTGNPSFKNCILIETGNYYTYSSLSKQTVAYNCIGIGGTNFFKNINNTTNVSKSYEEVFKTYRGTYNDNELFELVDAIQSFVGLDGTQVGIYGGNMPYDPTPSNPQITKCNVAAKSTADGKLSVDITVNGAE